MREHNLDSDAEARLDNVREGGPRGRRAGVVKLVFLDLNEVGHLSKNAITLIRVTKVL